LWCWQIVHGATFCLNKEDGLCGDHGELMVASHGLGKSADGIRELRCELPLAVT